MEPTESAAPESWLRRRRVAGVRWGNWWAGRSERRPAAETYVPHTTPRSVLDAGGFAAPHPGAPGAQTDRQPVWPTLPASVVGAAALVLGAGISRAYTDHHALFPSGTTGWALAVLAGVVVGHLVLLGRARWWGGTGSGGALTLAVLLLYGWVPAGMVSLTVVVLVGIARRHRWRQGVLHGAVDILGIGAGALLLAACGRIPSVERPWTPGSWTVYTGPQVVLVAVAYLAVTRVLLWYLHTPASAGYPPSPGRPWSDRAWSRWPCSASHR